MKLFFYFILNTIKLYLFQNKRENFEFFKSKIQAEFPRGLMFIHEEIQFFVKDYTSCEFFKFNELNYNKDKLFIICEYFDSEERDFKEKIMHEDFVRNRYKVFKGLI